MRCRWRLRFIWLPRCEPCVYEPGCWSCNAKIAGDPVFERKKAGNDEVMRESSRRARDATRGSVASWKTRPKARGC